MRRILTVVCISFAAALALAHHGPTTVLIDAAAKKQPPVPFNHGKHSTELVKRCDTCHHTNKGMATDKEAKVQKCSDCHLDPKGDVPSMREMSLTKNPFHNNPCINCHKEQKKGPTVCKDCHIKK